MAITDWHWDQLRAELERERAVARELADRPHQRQPEKWRAHADALGVALNIMRRLEREAPPAIDDIVTE